VPVQFLKGVGEKLGSLLASAEIATLWDLMLTLPRTYEDRRRFLTSAELFDLAGQNQTVLGRAKIMRYNKKQSGPGGRRWVEASAALIDEPMVYVTFTWFHDYGPGIDKRFPPDSMVIFKGKPQLFRGGLQFVHPEFQGADQELPAWERGFVPVYREISTLTARYIRKLCYAGLQRPEMLEIPEALPKAICERLGLRPFLESLSEIHFPKNWEPSAPDFRPDGPYFKRLVFEELFMMSLALFFRRAEWRAEGMKHENRIPRIDASFSKVDRWLKALPFELTHDQRRALEEIRADISLADGPIPMHRLVQGDVGSGKTILAFLAALMAVESNYQAALMAPTEILANQHYANFCKIFPEYQAQTMLLKGALTAKQKKEVRAGLESGQVRFVIGTQALLTDDTLFDRLGLVVVDEQHRFGVEQRLGLKHQAHQTLPHLLVMTATPIPRSLALTLYGDLNLTQIKEKPKGRQEIATHIVKRRAMGALQERLKKFLDEKRQIYLVYPLVEENEDLDLKDVQNAFKDWSAIFAGTRVGLLHGRMKSKEKDQVMRDFKDGQVRVLVSTTVIEVGVDVPNATVIVIEHAERFGLSQLHQLRGRVGRGSEKSFCILVSPDRMGPLVEERLKTLEQSNDGFLIAEKDLDLRGPGEFLGRRQSGLPGFRVAHILRDVELMEVARAEAKAILDDDPKLIKTENATLRRLIDKWWRGRMELTLSG
jgi:ATP-dependent DNA helicase RecG